MLPTADKVATYLFTSLQSDEILAFNAYMEKLIHSLEARDERGRSIFIEKTRPDG